MPHLMTRRPASPLRTTSHATLPLLSSAALLSAVVLLIAAPYAAQAQSEAVKKPKLTVEERVHETGEIARDQVVDHTFKLRNSGDAPLAIQKIVLAPNLEIVSRPASLAPGEAGELHVRVPLLYDKPVALLKQITLQTNDPETPSFELELRILSTEYVTAKPGYARWISVQHEKPATISQVFTAPDGLDFEVLRTSAPPAGIAAAISVVQENPQSRRKRKVDLTIAEDAPVGAIVGTLMVYVNHPKQSIVPIPLSGFMRPVMAVTPNTLSFGELKLAQKTSHKFTVQSFSTEPIHVIKVEHDLKGFPPASFEARTVGREYKIQLDFDPATIPKGAFRGTLKIHTDSAKMPLITVPLDGTIQ